MSTDGTNMIYLATWKNIYVYILDTSKRLHIQQSLHVDLDLAYNKTDDGTGNLQYYKKWA